MTSPEHGGASQSRRTDLISLVIAAILLVIAGIGIGGQTWWLIPNLLPWIIAGVAALVGLGLIVSSLPGRRTKHD
jgi:hypothetical protein